MAIAGTEFRREKLILCLYTQGTSADITKESLALLLPRLREVEGQLVMCVHDEIIVQLPERHQERVCLR